MIQDLHSHTYYSFCGKDRPEAIIEAAIAGGLDTFGICDHNYGIGFGRVDLFNSDVCKGGDYNGALRRYFDHLTLLKEKYAPRIRILRGIELCTLDDGKRPLPETTDVSYFDYCLVENLDGGDTTVTKGDILSYALRTGCPTGIAHTDMFSFIEGKGLEPLSVFKALAEAGVFWEMNVNYDSIHNHREHEYVKTFFSSPRQQEIVRQSGIRVSVGFDGHRVEDYLPDRVREVSERLTALGIKMPFED